MPTYEYLCSACHYKFEYFQAMSDEPLRNCPQCGGSVRRLVSGGTGLIFKGSGFYLTDYKNKTGSVEKKTEKKPTTEKSENKTTTTTKSE